VLHLGDGAKADQVFQQAVQAGDVHAGDGRLKNVHTQ